MAKTFTGIIDDHGLESFVSKKGNKFPFRLRAAANKHRHAVVYEIAPNKDEILTIEGLIDKAFWTMAEKAIKAVENYKEVA